MHRASAGVGQVRLAVRNPARQDRDRHLQPGDLLTRLLAAGGVEQRQIRMCSTRGVIHDSEMTFPCFPEPGRA